MNRPPDRRWLRPAVSLVAILVAYYAWPVHESGGGLVLSMLLTLLGIGVLAWAIAGQIRGLLMDGESVGFPALVTLLGTVVVVFAFGYYRMEVVDPAQMAGLRTKTDSLYFTMQMLTTVGLGDVHATGQLARKLALVQMLFDVVFVAAAGSLLANRVREQVRASREPGPPPAAPPSPPTPQAPPEDG